MATSLTSQALAFRSVTQPAGPRLSSNCPLTTQKGKTPPVVTRTIEKISRPRISKFRKSPRVHSRHSQDSDTRRWLRWQQAEGEKHAYQALLGMVLPVRVAFRTLCGKDVIPEKPDFPELGGLALNPTCLTCESIWIRKAELGEVAPTGELTPQKVWSKRKSS